MIFINKLIIIFNIGDAFERLNVDDIYISANDWLAALTDITTTIAIYIFIIIYKIMSIKKCILIIYIIIPIGKLSIILKLYL